jgi:hypothetical protein
MGTVILILALLLVVFVTLGVYVGVKAVRAAKRSVDRTVTQARRSVEETTLRAKSFGQLGVPGELARLRLRLRTSMRATQDALEACAAEDASLSESLELFRRLSVHGRELDAELKTLERDPDRTRVAHRLHELRERTERITRSADSLRWAARDRARRFAEDDLSSLSEQIDMESGALRHWSPADPSADGRSAPGPGASGTGAPVAGAPDPTVVDPVWPEPPAADEPQSIDPPNSVPTYPWQKAARSARPETTN